MKCKEAYKKITVVGKSKVKFLPPLCFQIFRYALLIGVCYVALYPVLECLSKALTSANDYMGGNVEWIPSNPTLDNFFDMTTYFHYWKHASITTQIVLGCTVIQMIIPSLVGYGLARYRFKGNMIVFFCVIATIIVPIQTVQIPLYVYYRHFDFMGIGSLIGLFTGKAVTVNILNTCWSYFVPALFGVGLNSGLFIFLFRQFFKGMPRDLEDAGRVDGCNPLMVFLRIMVPNVKPVFATVGLLSAIYYWNDYVLADMFMGGSAVEPIMLAISRIDVMARGLAELEIAQFTLQKHAILLLAIAPLMLIFLFCQKFFVECMDRSGIKG